jgi:hypothetical protein
LTLLAVGALLAVSLAASVHLNWIYWGVRTRSLEFVEDMRSQPHAIDEPVGVQFLAQETSTSDPGWRPESLTGGCCEKSLRGLRELTAH